MDIVKALKDSFYTFLSIMGIISLLLLLQYAYVSEHIKEVKIEKRIEDKRTEDTGIEYVVRVNRGEDTGEYYIKIQRKRD